MLKVKKFIDVELVGDLRSVVKAFGIFHKAGSVSAKEGAPRGDENAFEQMFRRACKDTTKPRAATIVTL